MLGARLNIRRVVVLKVSSCECLMSNCFVVEFLSICGGFGLEVTVEIVLWVVGSRDLAGGPWFLEVD